jgi:hypothetical protein
VLRPESDPAFTRPGDDRDQVLQGAAEPVQRRHNERVARTQVVQRLPQLRTLDVLAGLLVGEDPDAPGLGEGVHLPV